MSICVICGHKTGGERGKKKSFAHGLTQMGDWEVEIAGGDCGFKIGDLRFEMLDLRFQI